jgi:hypothetical protein
MFVKVTSVSASGAKVMIPMSLFGMYVYIFLLFCWEEELILMKLWWWIVLTFSSPLLELFSLRLTP